MFIGSVCCNHTEREYESGRETDCSFSSSQAHLFFLLQPPTHKGNSEAHLHLDIISMALTNSTQYPLPAASQPIASPSNSSISWQTEAVRGVQIAATLLIFLVGIPLNTLVVWALGLRSHRHLVRRGSNEETRAASSFRVYVLNLALADLVLLLRTPLMLGYLAHNFSWPFGHGFCRLVMFLRGLGLYASAFLLCAVALERCLCLLRPVWARLRRPTWAVPLVCGILWLIATILSAPYLHSTVLSNSQGKLQCLESGTFNIGLFLTETIAGFILPFLVFLGSNMAVLLSIKQAVPPTPTSSTPSIARKMTRMYHVLFFTMLLFLTCWVPYFVCRFLHALAKGKADLNDLHAKARIGAYISLYLVYIKSALNPVLYVFAARGLGRAIKASVVSTIERLFNDESTESIRRKSLKNSQM
ncbi:C5a anaphylatoxin chemotactic receptor 1 [Echeneis naucrates]|uniref:C5a anaphylatoxin chemotactic receptor 1-like n=1 Tax=Echeneis naucrates TaxID=173247 RepID=A0A665TTN5_ECHNA|nr:C5a anaphylatoxin chemotactic receptor 1-like [Echeneis naucrates]